MKKINKINWVVTLFILLLHLITLIGVTLLFCFSSISTQTWILAIIMWAFSGLSITAGYHRLFAHRAYQTHPAIRVFFALFGAANFQGSIIEWSIDHRLHHRYTDKEKDPYSIKKGFWHAHMTWLFTLDDSKRDHSLVPDLYADPIIHWQHKHITAIMIAMAFVLPMLIGSIWGDPLGGLLIAGGLRLILNLHSTWAINSICHTFGKGNYIEQSAKDNWLTALLTFGEGFHNFHHQFPIDFRNGIRWFDYDPTKWLIKLLSSINLASHLKKVSKQKILQYKISYQQANTSKTTHQVPQHIQTTLQEIYSQLQTKIKNITQFENKISSLQKQLQESPANVKLQQKINVHKMLLKKTWKETKKSIAVWRQAIKLNQKILAAQQPS